MCISDRFITVPDFLLEIIREYAAKLYEYQPEERLFECTKYWLKEQLERCCQRTGVKVIRVHDIRHSHASLLINMGTDALLVQQRLGHEKVSTTLGTYAHLYPDRTNNVADRLEACLLYTAARLSFPGSSWPFQRCLPPAPIFPAAGSTALTDFPVPP